MGGSDWLISYLHYLLLRKDGDWWKWAASFHEMCRRNSNQFEDVQDDDSSDTSAVDRDDPDELPVVPQAPTNRLQADSDDGDFRSDFESDVDGVFNASAMDNCELTRTMCRGIAYHTFPPQALGTRAASLPHKVSCICTQMGYETGSENRFEQFKRSGVSGTFDLGTEYGVGDALHVHDGAYFSEYNRPSRLEQDDGDMEADFPSTEGHDGQFLFDKMLSVAALLHIIVNATKELHAALPGFDRCMVFMTSLMGLLCYEGPRQAFLERVVRGGLPPSHCSL